MNRFWSKVSRGATDACWEWLGCRDPKGYGRFNVARVSEKAHRVAWRLTHGEIPAGMLTCHRCDNPGCVNPAHLFLGTPKDNAVDMASKGRGGRPPKIDREAALRLRAAGKSQREIATTLGVSQPCVAYTFALRDRLPLSNLTR